MLLLPGSAWADPLRVAFWNVGLDRRGPGLLLGAIESGEDDQVRATVEVIARVTPDILVLAAFDYDHDLRALSALAGALAEAGASYPHRFALRPNTGMATALDLDGDGRMGGPGDAQGFGYFAGQGGLAILSRLPIVADQARDFSAFLWHDLPGALLPETTDGSPFPSPQALAVQRLSSTAHWAVPVQLPGGARLALLTWYGSPPVFDGPEDRNGRRGHDEAAFWAALLDGRLPFAPPDAPFVLLGGANLDPHDGDGRNAAIRALLARPDLQDPAPASPGGAVATGGVNATQNGPAEQDTADWPDAPGNPGNLRVDYVLPSRDLTVRASGVFWPAPGTPLADTVVAASRHRLVWVDIDLP